MFAAVTHGVLRFSELSSRSRVEGKIHAINGTVGKDIKSNCFVVGIMIRNMASFPIEIEFLEIRTKLGNTVPQDSLKNHKFIINPNTITVTNDHGIDLANIPRGSTIEGMVEFKLKYGAKGSALPYVIEGKKRVVASFNDDGILKECVSMEG
ncbi:hypothetical protein [Methylocystis rosea]|uniref:hypothetical protein n=1 Tax=Methylocystis rosea TaxID=173366 RepID=UPI0012EC8391|nr:hypothetical protein [Methylocystis rosea]